MLRRARHRVRQFVAALRPRVDAAERAAAYRYLDAPQQRLFESMTPRDQQHGMEVLRRVRAASAAGDPPLFAAALLHDCGKGDVRLWHRVAFVLLAALTPSLLRRAASAHGPPWRQAMWRIEHHPRLGADLAERVGAHPDTVRLIRDQEARQPNDPRLTALQSADDA